MHAEHSGKIISIPVLSCRVIYATLTLWMRACHGICLAAPEKVTIRARRLGFSCRDPKKPSRGIMSVRHTLFDLPPERQYSGNHSSLRTMAFGDTSQHLPEATLVPRTSLPLGDILAVDKIALASQRNFQLFSQGPKWTVKLEHVGNRRLGVESAVWPLSDANHVATAFQTAYDLGASSPVSPQSSALSAYPKCGQRECALEGDERRPPWISRSSGKIE
jgi:hypothetical protein